MVNSIDELKEIMNKNCYNYNFYSIDGNVIYEGFGIDKSGELFIWYYTERGDRENLKYFRTEAEIAQYAYEIIINDKFAKSHLISCTTDRKVKENLIKILNNRQISYWVDEIPSRNEIMFRIYVIGCDIEKVEDLITVKKIDLKN